MEAVTYQAATDVLHCSRQSLSSNEGVALSKHHELFSQLRVWWMSSLFAVHQVHIFVLIGRISKSSILIALELMALAGVNACRLDRWPLTRNGPNQRGKASKVLVNMLPSLQELSHSHPDSMQLHLVAMGV